MSSNFNKIILRYTQAKKKLVEYSISLVNKLGTGIKSRAKLRKFNVMSMWIDYIENIIDSPQTVAARAASSITVEILNLSGSRKGVLSIETINGKVIPLCITKTPSEYSSTSEMYEDLVYKINNSSLEEGIQTHGIKAALTVNKLTLTFPKGAEYNNAKVSSFPPSFQTISTEASGGISSIKGSSQHSEELNEKILKILDFLAIELGIIYDTEGSNTVKTLLDESSRISKSDNRINLDSKNSLSDENNMNIEL